MCILRRLRRGRWRQCARRDPCSKPRATDCERVVIAHTESLRLDRAVDSAKRFAGADDSAKRFAGADGVVRSNVASGHTDACADCDGCADLDAAKRARV
jgi:hypothetical protein